ALSGQLATAVNSTITFLMMSLFGRGNLGQGAQKYETTDAKRLTIIHPKYIGNSSTDHKVVEAFGARRVLAISDELQAEDRQSMDRMVFDALGLTKGERDAVYEAVHDLVIARLGKAESLQAKVRRKRVEAVSSTRGIWRSAGNDGAELEE
ncbi:MAG: hypothetical protein HY682_00760, partial [Chloroflexi bacterium]|nr:hypothetical protein [Chloroflexota bacterium]